MRAMTLLEPSLLTNAAAGHDPAIATTLQALAAFPAQLEAHYASVPAGCERWAPPSWDGIPSERFTPLEQILHVRDIETAGYHVRFHRTLHEERPLLADIDSYALAAERGYASDDDAGAALVEFRVARARTVALLSALHAEALAHGGVRRLRPGHRARPDALPVQPRPAAPGGPAMAARPDRSLARLLFRFLTT